MKRREFLLKSTFAGIALSAATPVLNTVAEAAEDNITLVKNGKAQCAIYVDPNVMADDKEVTTQTPFSEHQKEMQRRTLREAVKDIIYCTKKMSSADVKVLLRAPEKQDKELPILIGEYAIQQYGGPKQKSPYLQGWRMVVSKNGVGLMGQSAESASYAVYELLDRWGCRWFMPGEIGEVIPKSRNIRLPKMDISAIPSTEYRGIWYADENFKRRNRSGGFKVSAGHALEYYITDEQRKEHPEWRAIIDGKPDDVRLKWSNPEVQNAIADAIIAKLEKSYTSSISLSPADGAFFDESDDTKLDAGDWDPSSNQISTTDRLVYLCNKVAQRVTRKFPDVIFGFLAYGPSTRPPVREKLHPNLVPQIAPITYCRAHAMTDTELCPSRPDLRPIVEGWGKVAPQGVSYYNYMFHLAETSVPYPMMHQMSEEMPIVYSSNVTFWQPETMPNFDSVLPAMWLTMRMSWDCNLKPDEVLDDFFRTFYGATAKPMRRYWQIFDDAWTDVPEHAGCGWGHMRRFTPKVLLAAREAMNEALHIAATSVEYQRVKIQDESLRQFEQFMQLRWDLAEGRLNKLKTGSLSWLGTQIGLGDEYEPNYAFTKVRWTPYTISGRYFNAFYDKTYADATQKIKEFSVVGKPLRNWKYQVAKKQDGEKLHWQKADFDDSSWRITDSAVQTWSDLGLLEYYGTVWYRQKVLLPKIAAGKKVLLWIAATDGDAKVFVNGKHIPFVNDKGEILEAASGYCKPFAFDVTSVIKSNTENQITIAGTRTFLNEMGSGGLLGPVYLLEQK